MATGRRRQGERYGSEHGKKEIKKKKNRLFQIQNSSRGYMYGTIQIWNVSRDAMCEGAHIRKLKAIWKWRPRFSWNGVMWPRKWQEAERETERQRENCQAYAHENQRSISRFHILRMGKVYSFLHAPYRNDGIRTLENLFHFRWMSTILGGERRALSPRVGSKMHWFNSLNG